MFKDNIQCSEGIGPWKKSGGDGAVVTPVTIPNTEVKHRSGEGSPHGREQRAAGLFLFGAVSAPFLLLFYPYFFSGF